MIHCNLIVRGCSFEEQIKLLDIQYFHKSRLVNSAIVFHRADLDAASALETLLQQLTCTGKWHSSVIKHANACLQSLADDSKVCITLSNIFDCKDIG